MLLTVVVVVASAVALGKSRELVPNAGATPGYNAGGIHDAATAVSGEPTAKPQEPPKKAMTQMQRILTVVDEMNAYRAVTGSCPETPAIVEHTSDGGVTWVPVDLAPFAAASSVQRIVAGLNGYAAAIALNRDNCESALALVTFDGGIGWQGSVEALSQTWYVDPANAAVLHDPAGGTVDAPCAVSRLTSGGVETVGLVCKDTRLFASGDGGVTWTANTEILGIDSFAGHPGGFLAVSLDRPDCDGVQVSQLDFSLTVGQQVCVGKTAVEPGQTAISMEENAAWLWAGDTIFHSSDGGATWSE